MKKTHNIRKCIVTQERLDKSQLIRVVRNENVAKIDKVGNINGRGAYIKPSSDIIEKAYKKNAFSRALKMKVDESIYDQLLRELDK